STHGSIQAIADFDLESIREGPRFVNPQAFSNTVINAPASRLAILFDATGVNSTIATGSASALDALGSAVSMLRAGRAGALLCGAALGRSEEILSGFGKAGRLARSPEGSVPFGAGREGAALSEGAGVFLLEDEARALARGTRPQAHIAGVCSAFETGVGGLFRSMRGAIAEAGLSPEDISAVIAFASGSREGDLEEGEAIGKVFAARAAGNRIAIPVTAPKSMTGDCLEASGAIGVALAVLAIEQGKIPPIARLDEVDRVFSRLDLVRGKFREAAVRHVLVNARDESGHCASVVISKP
ncbi:MAG: beta-ketoacyl synthase N-terminal-like domain-containing protein, partial [Vicinamibacteria bacterium]